MASFKRSLWGYRRADVDAAIAEAERRQAETDRELLVLSEMMVAREREAGDLRERLAETEARHERSLRSLESLAARLDEMHAQARGQATRIRMKALGEAVRVTERASDALSAIREIETASAPGGRQPAAEAERKEPAVERAGRDEPAAEGPPEPAWPAGAPLAPGFQASEWPPVAEPEVRAGDPRADGPDLATGAPGHGNGNHGEAGSEHGMPGAGVPEAAAGADLGYYQGDVEVEIGPLGDFSQLLGFESAAGGIDGAQEISVRRFAGGRATLGMRLSEPIELLRELEERAPFEFRVRQTGGGRLVLDIDDEQPGESD